MLAVSQNTSELCRMCLIMGGDLILTAPSRSGLDLEIIASNRFWWTCAGLCITLFLTLLLGEGGNYHKEVACQKQMISSA